MYFEPPRVKMSQNLPVIMKKSTRVNPRTPRALSSQDPTDDTSVPSESQSGWFFTNRVDIRYTLKNGTV